MTKRHLNDWAVAAVVIFCSGVILVALTMALTGKTFGSPARVVRAAFPDITGVSQSSSVRYAGAHAGYVYRVHPLSLEQRQKSTNPENTVELELALLPSIPELTLGTTAGIASDTLLSEKFVQIIPGPPTTAKLGKDAVLTGQAPTTFDQLSHSADRALAAISLILSGDKLDTGTIISDLRTVLEQVQGLLTQAGPILTNTGTLVNQAGAVVTDGKALLTDPRINQTLDRLRSAAVALDRLSTSGENVLRKNEANLNASLADLKVSLQNLKLLTTYGSAFTLQIAERPQSLIWGPRRASQIPSREEILRSGRPLVPPE